MRRYLSHSRVGRQRYGGLSREAVRSSRSTGSLPFRRPVRAVGPNDIHPMRRGGVKSTVDYFVLGRGVVISRAATSLRSVETQPLTWRFVRNRRTHLRWVDASCSRQTGGVPLPPRLRSLARSLTHSLDRRFDSCPGHLLVRMLENWNCGTFARRPLECMCVGVDRVRDGGGSARFCLLFKKKNFKVHRGKEKKKNFKVHRGKDKKKNFKVHRGKEKKKIQSP